MNKNLANEVMEQTARRAVVSYFTETIDDDSRVWRIESDAAGDALAHIDIGPTITFALNDPNRPVGAYLEDRLDSNYRIDFRQVRVILAELFGDEAANFIGQTLPVSEEDEELADWEREIFETEVSVEVKNPELARILGRLAVIDKIRRDRKDSYQFTEAEKQRAIEILGEEGSEFISWRERLQEAEDQFYSHNPIPGKDEIAIEEDKLLTQLSEWLVVPGLSGWIRNRRGARNEQS